MSAVFRGNFHFVPSRRLASCFGFAHPVPCKIPRSRTPRSLGGQQGLAQATRETSAGLVLTPVTGASLQIFTFMTWKTPWKFKKKKKSTPKTLAKHFVPSCCWNLLRSQARRGRAAALAVDYPFPLNFSLHFLSPPSWEEQLRLWSLCCSWSTAGKCRKSVTLEICLLPERDSPGRERFRGSSALYPDKWGCGEGRSCLWIPIPPPPWPWNVDYSRRKQRCHSRGVHTGTDLDFRAPLFISQLTAACSPRWNFRYFLSSSVLSPFLEDLGVLSQNLSCGLLLSRLLLSLKDNFKRVALHHKIYFPHLSGHWR